MDKIAKYRQIIRKSLTPYKDDRYVGSPELRNEIIFDSENDHYLVINIGWEGEKHVRNCLFHIDIKDGKVWIQEDNTDSDIADILVDEGISKSDIVLGFHSPAMRRMSSMSV